jgi:hypothetical protein
LPVIEALEREYRDCDAHFCTYIDPNAVSGWQRRWLKNEDGNEHLLTHVLVFDVDFKPKRRWGDDWREQVAAIPIESEGIYLTRHGYRLIVLLARPLRSFAEAEIAYTIKGKELEARGILIDWNCRDWTRLMRGAHVKRGAFFERSLYIDWSCMRPVEIDLGGYEPREKVRRGIAKRFPDQRDDLPQSAKNLIEKIVNVELPDDGQKHKFSFLLSGALLELGVEKPYIREIVRSVSYRFGTRKAEHHARNAEDTIKKFENGETILGLHGLLVAWPALHAELTRVPVVMGPIVIPIGHEGLKGLAAPCGSGKTHAAEKLALERARAGLKTAIVVDKNSLAIQIYDHVRGQGVPVARAFGLTSLTDDRACKKKETVSHFEGKLNVLREICQTRCEHFKTCVAKDKWEGDEKALIWVGTHSMLSTIRDRIGVDGFGFIDEAPSIYETERISDREVLALRDCADVFSVWYADHLRDAIDALIAGLVDEARGLMPIAERIPVVDAIMARSVNDPNMARIVGNAIGAVEKLSKALRSEDGYIGRNDENNGWDLAYPNNRLIAALQGRSPHVLAAADIELQRPLYEKAVGYRIDVVHYDCDDGAPINRTLFRTNKANRRAMREDPTLLFRFLEVVRSWAGERAIGVVVFKEFRTEAEAYVRRENLTWCVGHYNALRGLDAWSGLDGVATIGDPRPNLGVVQKEALYASVDPGQRVDRAAASELEQAHGRLRTPHRTMPGWACHIGLILPAGSGWSRNVNVCEIVARPSGQ